MKVAEMMLDSTSVKFYDDFSDVKIKELNYRYFENALRLMINSILSLQEL